MNRAVMFSPPRRHRRRHRLRSRADDDGSRPGAYRDITYQSDGLSIQAYFYRPTSGPVRFRW